MEAQADLRFLFLAYGTKQNFHDAVHIICRVGLGRVDGRVGLCFVRAVYYPSNAQARLNSSGDVAHRLKFPL